MNPSEDLILALFYPSSVIGTKWLRNAWPRPVNGMHPLVPRDSPIAYNSYKIISFHDLWQEGPLSFIKKWLIIGGLTVICSCPVARLPAIYDPVPTP